MSFPGREGNDGGFTWSAGHPTLAGQQTGQQDDPKARWELVERDIGHIWIGPDDPPSLWMDTWKAAHPGWRYRLYDNAYLTGRRFRNQTLIADYARRGRWAGVADLMRYEILFEEGGFLPEADSICLHPVDELFVHRGLFTVYENEGGASGLMSPFLAATAGHQVLAEVIATLGRLPLTAAHAPWTTTGNGFLRRFFLEDRPELKRQVTILPAHTFIPDHHRGASYDGPGKIYARQMWGSTTDGYAAGRPERLVPQHASIRPTRMEHIIRRVQERAGVRQPPPRELRRAGRKVMTILAHPDDAEIYMFGTLAHYKRAQANLHLVVATQGDRGVAKRSGDRPLAATRATEAEMGAMTLGARLTNLGFGDGRLAAERMGLLAAIDALIAREAPDIIFTHAPEDYHADHRVLSAAVTLATRERVALAYCDTMNGTGFVPEVGIDITDTLTAKLAAIRLHYSQQPRRYVLAARDLALARGREVTGAEGRPHEAFRLVGVPGQRSPMRLLPGAITPVGGQG